MDYELAEFVAWIERRENDARLVDEVKGLTFSHYREHALLAVGRADLLLARGGRMGILFELDADGSMVVDTPEGRVRVEQVIWHTHPVVTGPSDHDLGVLRLLGQDESIVHEINGVPGGTRFRSRKDG